MGDGGFWHNGLSTSVGNAVYNKHDGVIMVVDNFYAAATGGAGHPVVARRQPEPQDQEQDRGRGARHRRHLGPADRPHLRCRAHARYAFKAALTSSGESGPKVIVASSECMLNKQRRVKPLFAKAVKEGKRMVRERFGVDEDVCTGDHACIRLSGCPSLSVKHLDDPLRDDPVATIDKSCVGLRQLRRGGGGGRVVPVLLPRRRDPQPRTALIAALARRARRPSSAVPAAPARRRGEKSPSRWSAALNSSELLERPALRPPLASEKPIAIALVAMGGQGGGVVSDWLIALGEAQGFVVQATSVPGVAQRTGATIYYVEIARKACGWTRAPILVADAERRATSTSCSRPNSWKPGRSMLRGLVTPDRTTLIASTHRAYAVGEKETPGDGIADPNLVVEAAGVAAETRDRVRHAAGRGGQRGRDLRVAVRRARGRGGAAVPALRLRGGRSRAAARAWARA